MFRFECKLLVPGNSQSKRLVSNLYVSSTHQCASQTSHIPINQFGGDPNDARRVKLHLNPMMWLRVNDKTVNIKTFGSSIITLCMFHL